MIADMKAIGHRWMNSFVGAAFVLASTRDKVNVARAAVDAKAKL